MNTDILTDHGAFTEALFPILQRLNPGVSDLELYEFRYCMDNYLPAEGGWAAVTLDSMASIEQRIKDRDFFISIKLKPKVDEKIVLDTTIRHLNTMLFVGLATGAFPEAWVDQFFYFDVRGFYFLPRTVYFTPEVLAHFNGKPYLTFEQRQLGFVHHQGIGYRDFREANADVDGAFMDMVMRLIQIKGTPILITLAGPTAAGKTEIVERLSIRFGQAGMRISSIAMDDFLIDNDYREDNHIDAMGKEAFHFTLFMDCLARLLRGEVVTIPRYTGGVSSHDISSQLKPGYTPQDILPADIIFIEGNFPFQIPEVSSMIGLKIVYLTDDPIRLKRKWKRDIDYRNKYDPNYFRNRFFRTQFLRAFDCYNIQAAVADIMVDTTGAAIWADASIQKLLSQQK